MRTLLVRGDRRGELIVHELSLPAELERAQWGAPCPGRSADQLASHRRPVAASCFLWSIRPLRLRTSGWHQFLVNLKNAAYAWRQMLVFLSLSSPEDVAAFLNDATSHLAEQSQTFQVRFAPALAGVRAVVRGSPVERRFLGWSVGPHWLSPPKR